MLQDPCVQKQPTFFGLCGGHDVGPTFSRAKRRVRQPQRTSFYLAQGYYSGPGDGKEGFHL